MNIDNDNVEPAVDFGYSGDFSHRALDIESGAGVNAGLRIKIPIVASSPLSELVWSPHKGLGVKCAESGFMDRRPTNVIFSPIESMENSRTSNDKRTDENLLTPSHKRYRGLIKGAPADVLSNQSDNVKENVSSEEPSFGSTSGGIHGRMNECEASNFPTADITSRGRKRRAEQASVIATESKTKVKKTSLHKPESRNENDFLSPIGKDASKFVPSESTREVQYDLQKDEERKDKEKALSDGSHGSVESCNSAQLFPTGKKRWSFEQLLVQRKRAKMEIQASPCSASFVRKDSSFMNWISNMVKGFGKSTENKEYSAPLALTQPHHRHEHTDQKHILCEKTQDTDIYSDGNENSHGLVLGKENEGMSSKSSLSKRKTDSDLPSEGKPTHILSDKSDVLRSLWVTRFSPKTANAEISSGFERISDHNDDNPSQRLESSEAITSVFARRLDAIKHVIPSGVTEYAEMPTGMFDAIKRLCLARADILKWMNSHISLSRLNGLFLRLRLRKWEEGLGGTGYYVACIAGSEPETISPNSGNVIPVNVGNVKCLVESQYISNHDFLEDELMAWWSAALRNGSEIPRIEDLMAKAEEKKMLSF